MWPCCNSGTSAYRIVLSQSAQALGKDFFCALFLFAPFVLALYPFECALSSPSLRRSVIWLVQARALGTSLLRRNTTQTLVLLVAPALA